MNRIDKCSKLLFIIEFTQKAENTGKERGKRRQVNATLRDHVMRVKTIKNLQQNRRGLVEPATLRELHQIHGKKITRKGRENLHRHLMKIQRCVPVKTEENGIKQHSTVKGQKEKRKMERNVSLRKAVMKVTAKTRIIQLKTRLNPLKGQKEKREMEGNVSLRKTVMKATARLTRIKELKTRRNACAVKGQKREEKREMEGNISLRKAVMKATARLTRLQELKRKRNKNGKKKREKQEKCKKSLSGLRKNTEKIYG